MTPWGWKAALGESEFGGYDAKILSVIALVAVTAAPSDAEVQTAVQSSIMQPYEDRLPDGRVIAEFAPAVQTRNVACVRVDDVTFGCTLEIRAKDFFARDFEPWKKQYVRLVWRDRCWQMVPGE